MWINAVINVDKYMNTDKYMNIPNLLGWKDKDKDFQLGDFEYTTKFVANKLKDGWIILIGDIDTINMIEEIVFTPGTAKNEGFVVVMGKILSEDEIVSSLFLAKKTDLFKQRIMYWCNINEEVYYKLIMIDIIPSGGGVVWDYTLRNGKNGNVGNEVGNDLNNKFYDDFAMHIVTDVLKMEEYTK